MPTLLVSEWSPLSPDVILEAARDFSERRADLWPDVHLEYFDVHEVGDSFAEVTEGNPWPIGHVWERLRYDWSHAGVLQGTVVDSNLFVPGSTWEMWATPDHGGSIVEIRAVRHLKGRGWLLWPFFHPSVPGSAVKYVSDHLHHFLTQVENEVKP